MDYFYEAVNTPANFDSINTKVVSILPRSTSLNDSTISRSLKYPGSLYLSRNGIEGSNSLGGSLLRRPGSFFKNNKRKTNTSPLPTILGNRELEHSLQDHDSTDTEILTPIIQVLLRDNPISLTAIPTSIYSPLGENSPIPAISYSPTYKDLSLGDHKIKMVLEELIGSEEAYLNSVKLLQNYYIEPYITKNRYEIAIPVQNLNTYLQQLLLTHSRLLTDMKVIFYSDQDITTIAKRIANELGENAIEIHLYQNYCDIYEDVLGFFKNETSRQISKSKNWCKGWESFLEGTQSLSARMDLSFSSLIQRPVARIGKYRLILEVLLKYLPKEQHCLQKELTKIKSGVTFVNNNSGEFKKSEVSQKLDSLINFQKIEYEIPISLQFFGRPLLIGSVIGVWIENGKHVSETLGCVCFKSHLVLAAKKARKVHVFDPEIIISFSSCKILTVAKNMEGGLYTNYPNVMKIVFEHKECHYEILLIMITKKEYEIWRDLLTTLINFVNGPYEMNYSHKLEYLTHYPKGMNPYNVSLKSSNQEAQSQCYFQQSRAVTIQLSFNIEENAVRLAAYWNALNQNEVNDNELIVIKGYQREAIETCLRDLWSPEIPTLFIRQENSSLQKSKSWSGFKFRSFGNLRKSQSFSGTLPLEVESEPSLPSIKPSVGYQTKKKYRFRNLF